MALRIQVSGKTINYDITLKSRYTVIVGCSATGKSFLTDVLTFPKRHPGHRIKLSDSYRVVSDISSFELVLENNDFRDKKYVFIVDDDDSEYEHITQTLLRECTLSYFIFMTRNEEIRGVNYGLSDVYEFMQVGSSDVLIPAFTAKPEMYFDKDTLVVSEDSKSGYTFYSNLFSKNEITEIVDANGNVTGKDGIISMLLRLRGKVDSVFLCVDWCSFGSYLQALSSFLGVGQGFKVSMLLCVESFEYLLLRSNMLQVPIQEDDMLGYTSSEKYYESLLENVTKDTPFYQAHGGTLKTCYINACCDKPGEKVSCPIFLHGKDKFVVLFKGTEFEQLLYLAGRL